MAKATTSTRKTTTTSTKTAVPSAPAAKKAAPVVVTQATPVVSAPEMKKVDLVDAVVERSGIKKKFAKPAIEAALAILGEAIDEGRSLNLRPMGKLKVQRAKEVANGKVITARIRQPKDQNTEPKDGVAEAAE